MSEQKPFDFESVNYPMFKVTGEEKQELIRARAMPESAPDFLCLRINSDSLENKIGSVLGVDNVLESYVFNKPYTTSRELLENYGYDCTYPNGKDGRKLRDVWVDKLLAFNS